MTDTHAETARNRNNARMITAQSERIAALKNALLQIEKIGWREGGNFKRGLVECRAIAREAIENDSRYTDAETVSNEPN